MCALTNNLIIIDVIGVVIKPDPVNDLVNRLGVKQRQKKFYITDGRLVPTQSILM